MTVSRFALLMCFSFFIVSCSTSDIKTDPTYPKGETGKRREKVGTITNNGGTLSLGADIEIAADAAGGTGVVTGFDANATGGTASFTFNGGTSSVGSIVLSAAADGAAALGGTVRLLNASNGGTLTIGNTVFLDATADSIDAGVAGRAHGGPVGDGRLPGPGLRRHLGRDVQPGEAVTPLRL